MRAWLVMQGHVLDLLKHFDFFAIYHERDNSLNMCDEHTSSFNVRINVIEMLLRVSCHFNFFEYKTHHKDWKRGNRRVIRVLCVVS